MKLQSLFTATCEKKMGETKELAKTFVEMEGKIMYCVYYVRKGEEGGIPQMGF